jgi:hypothetical protein
MLDVQTRCNQAVKYSQKFRPDVAQGFRRWPVMMVVQLVQAALPEIGGSSLAGPSVL